MSVYKPEGWLIDTPENKHNLRNAAALNDSFLQERILEARAVICNAEHDLIVDLGCMKGVIPRVEGAIGIADGSTRDISIISRVNKPVQFKITGFSKNSAGIKFAMLSRRLVQEACAEDYIRSLAPGDIIPAQVTHLEPFGCFVDVGCGIASMIPIDAISVSRISQPSDRFTIGQRIFAVVREIDGDLRISLSHKELLGNWSENAAAFTAGETVAGIIRSVEPYGVFVELAPNLAGLAEPREGVLAGQHASVYIKNIIPEKMKIKLIIVDAFEAQYDPVQPRYFITEGRLDRWRYSPDCCPRAVETVFGC